MKIYANRGQKHTLDWFIGKPFWVLCYISISPYMANYLVKPIYKADMYYHCNIIHANFIGRNETPRPYMQDNIETKYLHIVEPIEIYSDSEQYNWMSVAQYNAAFGDSHYDYFEGEDAE